MDDATTIAALEQRVAELEALVARLADERTVTPTEALPSAPPREPDGDASEPATLDRRRLLTRGGTAAAGAVLGGVAATIATAAPAAAATGSFDTSTAIPALTATTTGSGAAIDAVGSALGVALHTTGRSLLAGVVGVMASDTDALQITATKVSPSGNPGGILVQSDGHGALIHAQSTGLWAIGDLAVEATGTKVGLLAAGAQAQILFAGTAPDFPMEPPRTRSDQHDRGEFYFDNAGGLWLCTAAGTPGAWSLIGGAGTAGAFTVLATPTRVYDTRVNSGLPGAGTGPVTGVRHDIDLTANTSGLPTDATAAVVTLTVTDTVANQAAYGQIYANGLVTPPSTSSINWTAANSLVATTTTTALTAGKVAISMNPGANVLIDVLGYYR